MPRGRQFWVVVHRWAGLTIALFMLVVGITGAIIPWQGELQRIIAPDRFVTPRVGVVPLSPLALRAIAEKRTGGVIDYVPLSRAPDEPAAFGVDAAPGRSALAFDEILLDPYDGQEIARDRSGVLADGWAQLIPFLYSVHVSLAMGEWGEWTLGVAALIWTIDCFVGLYLSLPVAKRGWWRRFSRSLRVRWRARGYRLNFDLHRASALWVWAILLLFAWSSVGFNLRQVYDPAMSLLPDYQLDQPPPPASTKAERRLDLEQALAVARTVAQRETAARGLHVEGERVIRYFGSSNSYGYAIRTERDRSDDGANSWVEIDAANGRLLRVTFPTGEHAGNTIDYWLGTLHTAGIFGLPFRVFVSLVGLLLTIITVTGVVIWMRKRGARAFSRLRRASAFSAQ